MYSIYCFYKIYKIVHLDFLKLICWYTVYNCYLSLRGDLQILHWKERTLEHIAYFPSPPSLGWRIQNEILRQSDPDDSDYFYIKIDRHWTQIYVFLYISETIDIILQLLTLLCIDRSGFHSCV